MADSGKRSAEAAGLSQGPDAKSMRAYDEFDALDPAVRAKLNDMFERGVAGALKGTVYHHCLDGNAAASSQVQPDDIDGKALSQLGEFPVSQGVAILEQFEQSGHSGVRNRSAFLSGVMTRFRRQQIGPRQHPDVQQQLDFIFKSGKIKAIDLDLRCYEALNNMPVQDAVAALERFKHREVGDVRNMSAFFMSNLKMVDHGVGYGRSGPGAGGGGSSHGSSYGGGGHGSSSYAGRGGQHGYSRPQATSAYPTSGTSYDGPAAAGGGLAAMGIPPSTVINPSLDGKVFRGDEQARLGVRVDEFHNLSIFSPYVHPAAAIKLQELWDTGVRLVALLDDRTWEALSELGAAESLAVIEEVAEAMETKSLRNPNAFFMSVAKKYLDKLRGPTTRPVPMTNLHPISGYGSHTGGGHTGSHIKPPRPSQYPAERNTHGMPGQLDSLPVEVQRKVEHLLDTMPLLLEAHFDKGVTDALNRLSQADALDVLEELARNDLTIVRSIPAYIMGICKRKKDSDRHDGGGRRHYD